MKKIAVVTVARSDYGIYLPVLRAIEAEKSLNLRIIAGGMHLEAIFGETVKVISQDGFNIEAKVKMNLSDDSPSGISNSMGLGVQGFGNAFKKVKPDLILLLGDRFEMISAALAAVPFNVPIAHIHGGEITTGAIDDSFRHAITKLSHLHFTSTEEYRKRVIQMGEQSDRVIVSGAPSLDNLKSLKLFTRQELERDLNIPFNNAPAVCTFHPVTTDFKSAKTHIENLLDALDEMNSPVIFTASNADTGSRIIMDLVKAYVSKKKNAYLVDNLGTLKYFSLMQAASFMIGNSSSGIIEAASFKLPVINIGTRQNGRIFPPNVINTDHDKMSIINAIKTVSSPDFKETISKANNPYGNGSASKIIVSGIMDFLDRNCSSIKHFNDLNCSTR